MVHPYRTTSTTSAISGMVHLYRTISTISTNRVIGTISSMVRLYRTSSTVSTISAISSTVRLYRTFSTNSTISSRVHHSVGLNGSQCRCMTGAIRKVLLVCCSSGLIKIYRGRGKRSPCVLVNSLLGVLQTGRARII